MRLNLLKAFGIFGAFLIIFLLIPIIFFIIWTDPKDVVRYGLDDTALEALMIGVSASLLSTSLLLISGIPLSYFLSRREFRGKGLLKAIIDLPLVIPHGVAGIMLLMAYNSRAPVGLLLSKAGITIEDSFYGIVAVMAFVSAPIMIGSLIEGFNSIDLNLEYVARSLGASEWRTFIEVTLPLSLRFIITGSLLSWGRGISEVGAILIVAYYPKSINVLIMDRFWTHGLRAASATALPLFLMSVAIFIIVRYPWRGRR